jgi:hypothetical protein
MGILKLEKSKGLTLGRKMILTMMKLIKNMFTVSYKVALKWAVKMGKELRWFRFVSHDVTC